MISATTELTGDAGSSAVATLTRGVRAAPEFRSGLGATLLFAAGGAAGRVAVPVLIQQAIDRGLRRGEIRPGVVTVIGLIGLVIVLLAAVSQRTAVVRLGYRAEDALYGLRVRLFEHIHRLSLADHVDERRGALVSRVTSDIETLTQFFSWGAIAWLLDSTVLVLVAGVMLAYDWMLALVVFVTVAPLIYVLRRVQRRLVRAYDRVRGDTAALYGHVGEMVTGAEMLRAYGAHGEMARRVKESAAKRTRSQIRGSTIGAFLFPSGEVFGALAVCAVVGVGVLRGPGGGLTTGAMIGFVFLTYRFLEPIAEFTEIIDQTQTAVAGFRRILGVLETPIGPAEPDHPVPLPSGTLPISIEGVSFSYRPRPGSDEPSSPALLDVDVRIPAGQRVAIVGSTGSGKSTLALLLGRFNDPASGVIRVGGVDLRSVANDDLRRRLLLVPQAPFLFDGTIESNLLFARPGVSHADIVAAVEQVGLTDWLDSLPEGLATMVGERGDQISAGERQLVALIRAALASPDILILDEATSAVDPLTEVRSARALEKLSEGRTTIAIAHRLSTAARAERVLVMENARLVEDGSHEELLSAGGVYARLYEAWVSATAA